MARWPRPPRWPRGCRLHTEVEDRGGQIRRAACMGISTMPLILRSIAAESSKQVHAHRNSLTTSNRSSGVTPRRSPAARRPTTSDAYATTGSSNVSRTATVTESPTPDTVTPSSSAEPTTGSYETASPTSQTPHTQPTKDPRRQPHLRNRNRPPPHPGRTRRLTSNPNLTQPERQTRPKLASRFRLCWGG
jgi:hypothetical protein